MNPPLLPSINLISEMGYTIRCNCCKGPMNVAFGMPVNVHAHLVFRTKEMAIEFARQHNLLNPIIMRAACVCFPDSVNDLNQKKEQGIPSPFMPISL